MKKVIGLLILCAVTMAVLSGCQTWDGFGRDVEKLGQKMQ
ncbi:MAG TPA: entericidin [Candidatus Omnitrophica bacterium]|nr:entericidin [Candidatus Omnitrophota bacterium]